MSRKFLDRRLSSIPLRWATWVVTVYLCACASSSPTPPPTETTPTFATTPLGAVTSTSGAFTMTMYGPANGVDRGLNQIEIQVTDPQSMPVDGLAINLVPWMPAMGHGTSITPSIQAEGSGRYVARDVALIMAGTWQLRTSLTGNEQAVVTVEVQ